MTFNLAPQNPAEDGIPITPGDADLPAAPRALYVGGAGDLAIVTPSGSSLVFKAVPAGTLLPIRALRVLDTSTATHIVGLI